MLQVDIKKRLEDGRRGSFTLDVGFQAPGGVTILFGPSGSGKTTTLRAIAGIVTPDRGRIALGENVFFDSAKGVSATIQERRVGYVFQDYALFPHLTAARNVAYAVRMGSSRERRERVAELLDLLGIGYAANSYPGVLSGGEQQRVALARALASDPALLLLDEPLSAVDLATRSRLLSEIKLVQESSGIPLLYVTHNPAEAAGIGTHLVVLEEGRVVEQGKPLDVLNAPRTLAAARAVGTENVFVGRVIEHETAEGTSAIDLGGCRVEAAYNALPSGTEVTIGVRSEDILISCERLTQTSARNVLGGTVKAVAAQGENAELVVYCGVDFKVSVTSGSVAELGLKPGARVYLLIKARAFHLLA